MPYKSEHAARIKSPKVFAKRTFRSKRISKHIRLIVAKRCGRCPMEMQAVRFNACKFTLADVYKWLRKHNVRFMRVEPATEGCKVRRSR